MLFQELVQILMGEIEEAAADDRLDGGVAGVPKKQRPFADGKARPEIVDWTLPSLFIAEADDSLALVQKVQGWVHFTLAV